MAAAHDNFNSSHISRTEAPAARARFGKRKAGRAVRRRCDTLNMRSRLEFMSARKVVSKARSARARDGKRVLGSELRRMA